MKVSLLTGALTVEGYGWARANWGREGPEEPRHCPVCGQQMQRFNYAINTGVFLDRCPQKHGIWLDPGELEQVQIVMEEFDREYDMASSEEAPEVHGAKVCPRCDVPLAEFTYENVTLDRCPKCGGAWLDGEELAEVVATQHQQFSDDEFAEIRAEEQAAAVTTEEKIPDAYPCLICGRMMNRMNYQYTSGIIIDRCPVGHGVWPVSPRRSQGSEREENRRRDQGNQSQPGGPHQPPLPKPRKARGAVEPT